METTKDSFQIKAYGKGELANMYGVSRATFYNWLKRAEIKLDTKFTHTKNILTPHEVKELVSVLGEP